MIETLLIFQNYHTFLENWKDKKDLGKHYNIILLLNNINIFKLIISI